MNAPFRPHPCPTRATSAGLERPRYDPRRSAPVTA